MYLSIEAKYIIVLYALFYLEKVTTQHGANEKSIKVFESIKCKMIYIFRLKFGFVG